MADNTGNKLISKENIKILSHDEIYSTSVLEMGVILRQGIRKKF